MNQANQKKTKNKTRIGNSKHTPGGWYAVGYQVETDNDDPSVPDICTCFPPNFGHPDTRNKEEILANVRLIASAPELLKVLKLANAFFSGADIDELALRRRVKAAIADATGDAN